MAFVQPAHRRHEPDRTGRRRERGTELGASPEQDGGHAGRLRDPAAAGMPFAPDTMPAMPAIPTIPDDDRPRCAWAGTDPLNIEHHDTEWGVPSRDRRHLFELLTLEGAQAGLSWLTILRKRAGYVRAFASFEPEAVADFTPDDVERLLRDDGIVRQRAKIESTIANARAILAVEADGASFVDHLWSFVGGRPIQRTSFDDLPSETPISRAMSKDLKRRGFGFVGPVTCYSFMESSGLVNNHRPDCFRHAECAALAW